MLKRTWVEQHMRFSSFVPLYCTQKLSYLVFKERNICSREIFKKGLEDMRDVLLKNRYPEPFVCRLTHEKACESTP